MSKPDQAVRQVNVKVNGITFESVRLRRSSDLADFDSRPVNLSPSRFSRPSPNLSRCQPSNERPRLHLADCRLPCLEVGKHGVEIASERLNEKYGTSLVCPECGSEFWRADE